MRIGHFVLQLSVASFCLVNGLPKRNCLGGRKHGSVVDLNEFYYFCNDGKLENRGCFAQFRKRLPVGERSVADGVETHCTEDPRTGDLILEYLGCSVNGKLHEPNEFWNDADEKLWYFCEQTSSETVKLNFGGCVWDGERIAKGKQIVRDGIIYFCNEEKQGQKGGFTPTGCMHFAKRYNLGNTFQDGHFVYSCQLIKNGTLGMKKAIACIHNDQHLKHEDKYTVDDILFQCRLHPRAEHKPFGCAVAPLDENDSPRFNPIGAQWIKGFAPYRYMVECQRESEVSTMQTTIACVYVDKTGRQRILHLDCVDEMDGQAVACRKDTSGTVVFAIFKTEFIQLASQIGLNLCLT